MRLVSNCFLLQQGDCLFRSSAFFKHNMAGGDVFLEAVKKNGTHGVSCYFNKVGEHIWVSPSRGSFGGPNIHGKVSDDEYDAALKLFEGELRSKGAKAIRYVLPPAFIDQKVFSLTNYILWSHDFEIERLDLNYHLNVENSSFLSGLSSSKRRALTNTTNGVVTPQRLGAHMLPEVYRVLESNRRSLGVELSMSEEQLLRLSNTFEDKVLLFGLKHNSQFVSAAVGIRINLDTLYVFYWGHHPETTLKDPITPLAQYIYGFCQKENIQRLDLGTSTIGKEPNWGLMFFKKSIGCIESIKPRYIKHLK